MSQARRSLYVTVYQDIEKKYSDCKMWKYVCKPQAVKTMIKQYFLNQVSSEIEDTRTDLRIVKKSLKGLGDHLGHYQNKGVKKNG